jgi:hypothetical protein
LNPWAGILSVIACLRRSSVSSASMVRRSRIEATR